MLKKKNDEMEIKFDVKCKDMYNMSLTTIPSNCYVDDAFGRNCTKYEIFLDGKKIHDVFGVIRYGETFTSDSNECQNINWQTVLEDF